MREVIEPINKTSYKLYYATTSVKNYESDKNMRYIYVN